MQFVLAAYKRTRRRAQIENLIPAAVADGGRRPPRVRDLASLHR